MKITLELRKAINAAARQHGMGGHIVEVGYRDDGTGQDVNNTLLWPDDSDLSDIHRFSTVTSIDDDPANPGCHALDLYVYSVQGSGQWRSQELETNVYVLIRDGQVILATNASLKVKQMAADIGFPAGKGW